MLYDKRLITRSRDLIVALRWEVFAMAAIVGARPALGAQGIAEAGAVGHTTAREVLRIRVGDIAHVDDQTALGRSNARRINRGRAGKEHL